MWKNVANYVLLILDIFQCAIEMELNCRRLSCRLGEHCVYRKNWCRIPPCPGMVFCSAEKKARTPASCDYVKCSRGYRCSTRYARDQRTGLYTNIYAYCVTEHEFKRRAVSCGGFECPRKEFACMLREPKCRAYPCRILQACIPRRDVDRLIGTCNLANCSSFDHCYLKRSTAGCVDNHCRRDYRLACLHMRGEQPLPEICRGIICADLHVPVVKMRNCVCQPCNDAATCAKIKSAYGLDTYNNNNISREVIL
ncbi:uncharacterized protein LOC107266777 isoform X2 [Cephus cinctus]|uniref:Uncharacterized protein LOC107266777 isoform X2 n=1 Tax=Cephus cinctus TaxID=211228 RepID=A0AAJ7FI85_CEPCN|nr:uncharacterized protein LOC107266777 isoform X2 [Cephus cinctus]XP_015593112.1 uncharacterized protein LOC107266777 isoform X2 [Cephus cinctus]XP_024939811.1 uncharacterized protein LOC107266777 isoform X2 [Cephus cinctus]